MIAATNLPEIIASRYRPIRLIAIGGMGAVYEVEHMSTGERLALKVLAPGANASPGALDRFKHEVRASARIRSENVVRVTDADVAPELGSAPFLVMELLDGVDLERAAANAPLEPAVVVELLRQAARAIDKAHRLGIVHRDLKPENLFLVHRADGRPLLKVLDFGIVKMLEEGTGVTGTGQILGTPRYMAPEQVQTNARITPATDRCALGLIAYRLLTGESYYQGGVMVILAQLLHAEMQAPSDRGSRWGGAFDAWFLKACHRNPDQRFATAAEQVEALAESLGLPRQAIDQEGGAVLRAMVPRFFRGAGMRWTLRRAVLVLLPFAVVASAIGLAALRPSRKDQSPSLVCGLPDHEPEAGCGACMAQACCGESQECAGTEGCASVDACVHACGAGDSVCRTGCAANKGTLSLLQQGLEDCRASHCASQCLPPPWACVGRVKWQFPSLTPPSIAITTTAVCPSCGTGGGGAPLGDVHVRLCSMAEPRCDHPLASATTHDDGRATLTVDTRVYKPPLAVFLEYRKDAYLDSLLVLNTPPIFGDRDVGRMFLLDPKLNTAGAASMLGTTYDPSRAHVMVAPADCNGQRATDRVDVTWLDRDAATATMANFTYTRGAMAMNLPINEAALTRIVARVPETNQLVATTSVVVRPRALTYVPLAPIP